MSEITHGRDIAGIGYTTTLTHEGAMVLSTHSDLEIDALAHQYHERHEKDPNDEFQVFFAAENTFGVDNPSTSLIGADKLVELGVPANIIHIGEGLDNTESQIIWLESQKPKNPELLALGFHCLRNRILIRQHHLKGRVVNAEKVIEKHHPTINIRKIVATKVKIAGMSAIYPIEIAMTTLTAFGDNGKAVASWLRAKKGAEGATITDYEGLDSAKNYYEAALKRGVTPHYQYPMFGYRQMLGAEGNKLREDTLPVI